MKITVEIEGMKETVKLIEKINSLTAELKDAVNELQYCSKMGHFEISDEDNLAEHNIKKEG